MKNIKLFNSLSRKTDNFLPINEKKISVYTCGPTVYNYAHIGNLRAYVFADILVRMLRYNYGQNNIKWVMNITDVDDKTIRDSQNKYPDKDPMEALRLFTGEYEQYFWEDLKKLNINKPDSTPHAAGKFIKEQQELVAKIFDSGYAYIKDGSVYFDLGKYCKDYKYGNLINIDMAGFKAGVRIDADEYEKENVQDFVLWKGKKDNEPFWNYKLDGKLLPGRPGWHIECSAMAAKELSVPFDIHTGGVDLKFPHHENEIAQSVVGYGAEQPVNYWLHNEFLLVDGKKMSKRFNNFYTLRDIENKGVNPLAFRFLCLQTHYTKTMNFTFKSLSAAQEGLRHLYNQLKDLQINDNKLRIEDINKDFLEKFLDVIYDDLNMTQALAVMQEMLKSNITSEEKLATALEFDKVLGLNLNKKHQVVETDTAEFKVITGLVEARKKARSDKNYAESDRLREEIDKLGYIVEDTSDGQNIYKK